MDYTAGTKVFQDWEIVRLIGEGANGKVYEIQRENYGVITKSALKVIRIPKSVSDIKSVMYDGMDEKSATTYFRGFVDEIIKEISVMSELKSHANIVSYEDHCVIEHKDTIGWDILIRMELLTPLQEYMMTHEVTENEVIRLGKEMCQALVFCQIKGLIHRDIKPENIFANEAGQFKLGDFGIARTVEKTTGGLSKKGTESYMAPEVYLGKPYGVSVDIYSVGLVLYRLMNKNRLPFFPPAPEPIRFEDRENALSRRMNGEKVLVPSMASKEFAEVILKACVYKTEKRFHTAEEMLKALELITIKLQKDEKVKNNFHDKDQSVDNEFTISFDFDANTEETINIEDINYTHKKNPEEYIEFDCQRKRENKSKIKNTTIATKIEKKEEQKSIYVLLLAIILGLGFQICHYIIKQDISMMWSAMRSENSDLPIWYAMYGFEVGMIVYWVYSENKTLDLLYILFCAMCNLNWLCITSIILKDEALYWVHTFNSASDYIMFSKFVGWEIVIWAILVLINKVFKECRKWPLFFLIISIMGVLLINPEGGQNISLLELLVFGGMAILVSTLLCKIMCGVNILSLTFLEDDKGIYNNEPFFEEESTVGVEDNANNDNSSEMNIVAIEQENIMGSRERSLWERLIAIILILIIFFLSFGGVLAGYGDILDLAILPKSILR